MKTAYLFFFLLIGSIQLADAQVLYRDTLHVYPRKPLLSLVRSEINDGPSYTLNLPFMRLPNSILPNPAVRYAIQNLKKNYYSDQEVDKALDVLINYAESARLKYIVEYLRRYARRSENKEKAFEILQNKVTYDSIQFYKDNEHLLTSDYEEYANTDLQTFLSYIRSDSNYIWLKKACSDSVLIEMVSTADRPLRVWLNNGREEYYRFWTTNRLGDTIGSWVKVLPHGNCLQIYVDGNVYQSSVVKKKHIRKEGVIKNPIPEEIASIYPIPPRPIRRRYWTYYSEVEVAMSQGALVNWASGGENSLSLLSNIRYFWNYNKNSTSWENWLHYRFGFLKNGGEDIRKNEDRFELNSKLGQKAFKHWYYTAQFNVLTQLFNSYDYPKDQSRKLVANFMSPGYFTLSLGLDYKPSDNFSLFISPIAGKWNFVRDTAKIDANRYGVEDGKRYKRNAGARLDLRSKINNIFKMINIRNELTLFWSYDEKDRKKDDKKILPFTANWKLTIDFKINYFMRASIYTETVYDENYSDKIQFKENLNLGVNFRF